MNTYILLAISLFCTNVFAAFEVGDNFATHNTTQTKKKNVTRLLNQMYIIKTKQDILLAFNKQNANNILVYKSESLPTPVFIQSLLQFVNGDKDKYFTPVGKKVLLVLYRDTNVQATSTAETVVVNTLDEFGAIIHSNRYSQNYIMLDITSIAKHIEVYSLIDDWYSNDSTHRAYELITQNGCMFKIGTNGNVENNNASIDNIKEQHYAKEEHNVTSETDTTNALSNIAKNNRGSVNINIELLDKKLISYIDKWLHDNNDGNVANRYMRIININHRFDDDKTYKNVEQYESSDFVLQVGIKQPDAINVQDNIITVCSKEHTAYVEDAVTKLKQNDGIILYIFVLVGYEEDFRGNATFNKCYWFVDGWHDNDPRRYVTPYHECKKIGPFVCFCAKYTAIN